jgi:phosphoribosylformylglycinamidine synthase
MLGYYISSMKIVLINIYQGNWMWAAKLPGEGCEIYETAIAMRDMMVKLGIGIDGGKDSLSMASKVIRSDGKEEIVKAPGKS